ncbi:hypothetical protein EW145_g1107 [Phellinidium pouzarii]|uniref:VPS9 domain-containing protein n=1 Tax=Phellinidium pouzarii TaxID=167371 RepID=A0A4S4LFQ0_9AGAM|nr:hypothetical protein EW145_g1107 [Phellinidium pouzarii]
MSMRSDTLSNLRPSSPAHGDGRLQRTSSHELLTAHPLLSPGPSSLSVSTSVGGAPANSNSTLHSSPESTRIASGSTQVSAPKYLPYTPRQARAVTGSATTGTASSPVSVSPQQQHVGGSPSATSRLQLQNLKAVAQNHGLDVGCLGWVMLEELVGGLDHASAWSELWGDERPNHAQATLLLPTEQASSHEAITPEMMKDHIIFCNGSARNDAPVVTLSGLRGTIDESALKFQSTLATESKSFKALSNPSTRSSALLTLPPLPIPFNPSANYPHVLVQAFIPFLPIPPRSVTPPKPPLPPRPGSKPVVTPNVSRLSNPFASFFSKPSTPSSPASTPHLLPDAQPIDHVVEVSAFTIEQPIVRRNISKALTKCVKSEIKDMLAGSPTWVVERTNSFSASLLPFPKPFQILKENTDGSQGSSDQNSIVSVSANNDTAEEVSQAFQNFYDALEEELKSEGSPSMLRRKDDKHDEEEKRKEQDEHDKKVQDILEKVERTLTCVFYNRLFGPSDSDDASHDETLSSRIAALNMLELSLEHLGVDVGDSKNDVDRIVSACGETISQLSVARCPADKAAIMIASHRIIVDGLSRLPPLRLKSEEQIDEDRTPQAPAFDHDVQNSVGTAERDSSLSFPKLTVSPDPSSPPSDYSRLEESGTSETIRADALEDDGISSSSIPSSLSQANVVEAPLLTVSPPKTPTPVSGDILLPLIIFSVVKANPPQLVSHLLFTQRFRNQSVGGEESYCLINLMAVVEFLENVDLGALGLKESEKKVMSAADLTPIPLAHLTGDKSAASTPGIPAGFRGRVEQQVDALAGSANKVFSGVVDSGFGVFRSLLPATPGEFSNLTSSTDGAQETAWNSIRPGFGLLRRESGFSIASLAASLPGRDRGRSFASSHNPKEEEGQEMVESRPVSVRSMILDHEGVELEGNASTEGSEESGDGNEDEDEDDEDEDARHDMRSIRSFESMMSGRIQSKRTENAKKERMSLSDRLAHMSRLTKGSKSHSLEVSAHQGSPPPRSSALLSARELNRFDTPMSSRTSSPVLGGRSFHVAPPNRRFLECTADDLKMSEIPELLQEYQRLVENVRSMGAFDEHS